MADFLARIRRAQDAMRAQQIDALFISAPSDLLYLIGYHFHPTERMTMLFIPPEGQPSIIMPQFEASRLSSDQKNLLAIRPWIETQNPVKLLANAASDLPSHGHLAVSDQMWAGFLVAMLEQWPAARFTSAAAVLTPLRMMKDDDEIAALEHAQHIVDDAFEHICRSRFAGRRELDVQRELTALRQELGLDDAYGGIIGSGPQHSASPHHRTGERIIQAGDAVVMDFGGTYQGYHADITRTVHIGPPSQKFREVYAIVEQANQAAFNAYQVGASCESVDQAARSVIEAAGYGAYFTHRLGHGIGLDEHEPPYLVVGNTQPLQADMTFSNEPGIYIPGEFGVRIEDIVVVTDAGARRLNRSTHELMVVE
ncbi:MAG: Xaa-Pro peptidase family protein [Chloroflexi bacterium]|nr:Xaa-Pro peptidase family protein [Chloroflexota bacterium]